jgi:uncharacterized membrane protein
MKLYLDNYFGIAFLIVFSFIILNFIKNLCAPKKKKRVVVQNVNSQSNIESEQKAQENQENQENTQNEDKTE